MPFGDFNNDGHVDGRDYALFKIATGDNDLVEVAVAGA